ncbi:Deoxyuridine 5'-triphosphate nucleotidohydrolase [Anaerovibrio sp. JC8]|uniref:dUTP diphosphatase n=1 Tax=Anaerovibrio sp. JC8 TaxID=1240085 RepID=UPI000A0E9132|nr:dUTP diphosphatase [Anaerovibrio sp. JC8]ORU00190.1 Deoxyuridine 5'-triphosphate nucleotidohydrolase [Anaerovibrio sp. JC8]
MTEKNRGFQVVSTYKGKNINLPKRKTGRSAGYDIEAAEDVTLVPHKVVLVPTGLKAYMQPDEYLGIHVRSGISIKNSISCINSQGIIDADYYNNPDNEGHIMVPLINHGDKDFFIGKGTRVAQGIFYKYLTVDGDEAGVGADRVGGFGSTGK